MSEENEVVETKTTETHSEIIPAVEVKREEKRTTGEPAVRETTTTTTTEAPSSSE